MNQFVEQHGDRMRLRINQDSAALEVAEPMCVVLRLNQDRFHNLPPAELRGQLRQGDVDHDFFFRRNVRTEAAISGSKKTEISLGSSSAYWGWIIVTGQTKMFWSGKPSSSAYRSYVL